MTTLGWASFASINRREVVVAVLTPVEFNGGEQGLSAALNRVSAALGRDDLKVIQVVRVKPTSSAAGLSFQQFRKSYRPARLIYTSLADHSEATLESEQSLEAFLASGGVVTYVDA